MKDRFDLFIKSYAYYTILYFGIDHSTANTRHSSNKRKKYSDERLHDEDLELDNASFVLASFYVLKVLFIDMTISLGDVCTDFWQVLISFLNSQSIHSILDFTHYSKYCNAFVNQFCLGRRAAIK